MDKEYVDIEDTKNDESYDNTVIEDNKDVLEDEDAVEHSSEYLSAKNLCLYPDEDCHYKFEEIEELLRRGNQDEIEAFFLRKIDKYIVYCYQKEYSTYYRHVEDLLQEARIAVLEQIPRYDASRKIALTTFFKPHIRHAFYAYVNKTIHGRSPHYAHMTGKIKTALKKYDMTFDNYDIDLLAAYLDISPIQVKRYIDDINKDSNVSIDTGFGSTIGDDYSSPEDAYFITERYQMLVKSLEAMPPEEKLVFSYNFGIPCDINPTGEQITNISRLKKLAAKKGMIMDVPKCLAKAIQRCKLDDEKYRKTSVLDENTKERVDDMENEPTFSVVKARIQADEDVSAK